ncbi:PREDICTED: uncharacterized protein LOC108616991 [Drosophila arizonae]|uniref:Uncharacterized protein LOC108616991 n=1 Tax=Drosophila arizonae TaxID=7263 RepID=A0ABM1PLJ7_DROAR|nr:PREDICTED: uncharacterized protein LOC108616991 [Drosophila arizonae]
MKIYPNGDAWFYVDKPGCWGKYERYSPQHSWKPLIRPIRPKIMYHWHDYDGVKKAEIKTKDLYFDNWQTSRIRAQACLGMLYATGYRFVKLSMAPPAGFKCAPLPVNLVGAYHVNEHLKQMRREANAAKKAAKLAALAIKKAELAFKNRAKKRPRPG